MAVKQVPDIQDDVKFEEALAIAGYGKFNMFIIFLSGLVISSSLLSSMDVAYLLPAAECDFQLTSADKGFLGSAYFLGIISASHISGFLADTLGRKYVLVRGLFLNVVMYVLGSLAPNFWTFLVLKVGSGIVTCPCMIATYPFLGEYIPFKQRSQAVLLTTALSTTGIIYSTVVGWAILTQQWTVDIWLVNFSPWRLFYLLCALPSLLAAWLLFITPESPKFLLTRGKKGDTMKVLQRVHSLNSGTAPQSYPVLSVSMDADEVSPPVREKGAAGVIKHICDQTLPLLRPPHLSNLCLCVTMYFTVFCCANAMLLWLPEIINRIALYKDENEGHFYLCEMVIKEPLVNDTDTGSECSATISGAVFIPNLFIALFQPLVLLVASFVIPLMDRRAFFMLMMLFTSGISVLAMRIADASIILILLGSMAILAGLCFNVLTTIVIEIFPTYIRAMAVSLAMICGRIGSITGTHLFSSLIDGHCSLLFYLLSGLFLCCASVPFGLNLKKKQQETPMADMKTEKV